jgi:hypothetical protein
MSITVSSIAEFARWKAQQEANRAARLRELHSAAELWQRQQRALDELVILRPDLPRPRAQGRSSKGRNQS